MLSFRYTCQPCYTTTYLHVLMHPIRSVILGTGRYVPAVRVSNDQFAQHTFFHKNGSALPQPSDELLQAFTAISGIHERRYAQPQQQASDLGFLAARDALESTGVDPESLDYLLVAHNFGDVAYGRNQSSMVPSLASRIKAQLAIKNPNCIAYDLTFGCPGWLEGVIQANYYIRSGDVRRCLVIGTETLSRVVDPYDRDSLLFGDGAGAVLLQAQPSATAGIIAHSTQTHAHEHAHLLAMDRSYAAQLTNQESLYMKMNGRKLYEFALSQVPPLIKATLDKAGLPLTAVSKVLLHQANEKMDVAILQRLFKLYGLAAPSLDLMPMTISWLGNSSVATIPTLLDLIWKGELAPHQFQAGDVVVFASVGAGMNINAVVYRC